MQKLTDFVTRLTKGRWKMVPPQTVDILQAEIDRLENNLAYTSPPQKSTKPTLQELQKFMDLAG
jgi:hypothetical protein